MKTIIIVTGICVAVLLAACGGGSSSNANSSTNSKAAATFAPAPTTAASNAQSAAATSAPAPGEPSAAVPTTAAVPTNVPAAQPTLAPTAQPAANTGSGVGVPIGNIKDVLKKACDAFQAQPNVTIHTVATGVTTAETTISFAGTDSGAMTVNLSGKISALTIISPTVYSQEDGKWTKNSDPGGAAVAMGFLRLPAYAYVCFNQDDPDSQINLGAATSNMALPDIVDGVPTLTYEVSGQFKSAEITSSGTIKYWLGATDSLPRKFTVNYTTKDGTGSAVGTYNYDKPNIQAPIP